MFESYGLNLALAIMAIVLATGALGGYGVYCLLGILGVGAHRIKTSEFMAAIKKLVGANNVDRAIKLCNAEISESYSPLPPGAKLLLCRANKTEELDGLHREAVQKVDSLRQKLQRAYRQRPRNFALAFVPTMVVLVALSWAHLWASVSVIILLTLMVIPHCLFQSYTRKTLEHFDGIESSLTELHNDLVARKKLYSR